MILDVRSGDISIDRRELGVGQLKPEESVCIVLERTVP